MNIICGINPVLEALSSGTRHFDRLLVAKGLRNRRVSEAMRLASQRGVPLRFETRETLDRMAGEVPHQGLVGVVSAKPVMTLEGLLEQARAPELVVVLDGRRAQGRYALFQTDGRNWMIHRMDPPDDPSRSHPPERFDLVQAQTGPKPRGRGWALETRWHGLRAVLTSSGGVVDLVSAGKTLKANKLAAVEEIMPVSARLIVNQAALKTRRAALQPIIDAFAKAAA